MFCVIHCSSANIFELCYVNRSSTKSVVYINHVMMYVHIMEACSPVHYQQNF